MLGEPARTAYDLKFALFGIPIRVHPLFWLAGLLLGSSQQPDGPRLLVWMVAFFLGILCHELGHALVMRSQGCFSWITLYGLGGLASCDRSRTTGRYPDSWRQIAVAAAGPLAGFLLAAIVVGAVIASKHAIIVKLGAPYGLRVFTDEVLGSRMIFNFADDLLFVTVVYGILNLLPVYPLDGGQIAREILTMVLGPDGVRVSLILSMTVAACLAVYGGVKLRDPLIGLFFGFHAYSSFATLQSYTNNRPW
jgi:stage IV sporulation protein FB